MPHLFRDVDGAERRGRGGGTPAFRAVVGQEGPPFARHVATLTGPGPAATPEQWSYPSEPGAQQPPRGIRGKRRVGVVTGRNRYAGEGIDRGNQPVVLQHPSRARSPVRGDVVDAEHGADGMPTGETSTPGSGPEHLARYRTVQVGHRRAHPSDARGAPEEAALDVAGSWRRAAAAPSPSAAGAPSGCRLHGRARCPRAGRSSRPSSSPIQITGSPPKPSDRACASRIRSTQSMPAGRPRCAVSRPASAAVVPLIRRSPVASLCLEDQPARPVDPGTRRRRSRTGTPVREARRARPPRRRRRRWPSRCRRGSAA